MSVGKKMEKWRSEAEVNMELNMEKMHAGFCGIIAKLSDSLHLCKEGIPRNIMCNFFFILVSSLYVCRI